MALILALLSAGCASMEPAYVRPTPAIPPSWPVGDAYLRQSEATLPAVTYQQIFRDPRLQNLIGQALVNNQDLATAAELGSRLEAAWSEGEVGLTVLSGPGAAATEEVA